MAPSASATTPPVAGRVAAESSAKIRSCAKTFCPTTRPDSRWIAVPTPGAPKPSSYSLQPTTPSSVEILTKW